MVDGGFLELVRYGIYSPYSPLIVDSLKVVDEVLKVETPNGPCWRRYSYDGYGQGSDGSPFVGVGQGRAWPLLTGERAHYELAAGRNVQQLVKAIENFAGPTGLLPEQIWDAPDLPEARMEFGCPTGSAMPLMWAHAEYIKLLRSIQDRRVFDRVEVVANRYSIDTSVRTPLEIWKFNRQPAMINSGDTLRIQGEAAFRLRWSIDDWTTFTDANSTSPGLGVHYVDVVADLMAGEGVKFTFWWIEGNRWEGRDFAVQVVESAGRRIPTPVRSAAPNPT